MDSRLAEYIQAALRLAKTYPRYMRFDVSARLSSDSLQCQQRTGRKY